MNVRKLLCACAVAVMALAMTGCPKDDEETADASTAPGLDATTTTQPDTGVAPGLDAGTPDACTPNCDGRECGPDGCGGTCAPGCTGTKTCSTAAGVCVEKNCNYPVGPCGADQYCDITGDPVCVDICNPACEGEETCVHDSDTTGHCEGPKCSVTGEECEPGQNCDYYWGSFAACTTDADCTSPEKCEDDGEGGKACMYQACSCIPEYTYNGTTYTDTCASLGMVCAMDLNAEVLVASKCRLPEEFEDCKLDPGCGTPADGGALDCVVLSGGNMCMRNCNNNGTPDTTMCAYDFTFCVDSGSLKNHCYFNICADVSCYGMSNCTEDQQRALYFQPCSNVDLNDSTCVQWTYEDHSEIGVCLQGGKNTASGAACSFDSYRTEPYPYAKHCKPPTVDASGNVTSPGEQCMGVQPDDPTDPNTTYSGTCVALCNAYTGTDRIPADNCAAGTTCLDVTGDPQVAKTWMGYCLPECDLFGSDACADDVLGNHTGCTPAWDFEGRGYCTALKANAAGLDETCVYDDVDSRNACGDRLTCMQYTNEASGKCTAWCSTTGSNACTDPAATCAACSGTKCCQPSCTGKCSGESDGCGGTCGCDAGEKCVVNVNVGTCTACTADEITATCGTSCGISDGCGGTCGCATAGDKCNTTTHACYTPACTDKCSGESDGGNGTCGCAVGEKCVVASDVGTCTACTAAEITATCGTTCGGPDGCGGTCGCESGKICSAGACVTCTPNCYMKTCGSDGCGGTCGDCGSGTCQVIAGEERCKEIQVNEAGTAYVVTPVQACDYHCEAAGGDCTRTADCCGTLTCVGATSSAYGKCQ